MDILTVAYGSRILPLTEYIEAQICLTNDEKVILNEFKDVFIVVDQQKNSEKNKFNRTCVMSWSDLSNAFLSSPIGKNMIKSEVPKEVKKVCSSLQCYLASNCLFDLFNLTCWRKLYNLVGTQFMNFIIFHSCLFLPLSNDSYVALHEERSLRALNVIKQTFIRKTICSLPKSECVISNKRTTVELKSIFCIKNYEKESDIKRKSRDSKYGFNGSQLLSLRTIMYNRSGIKCLLCNICCNVDNINNEISCEYLLDLILREDVGVMKNYENVDLSGLKKVLCCFIKKYSSLKKCGRVIFSILKMKCNCDEKKKRKSLFENVDLRKRRKLNNNNCVENIRKENSNKKSIKPESLRNVRKLIVSLLRKVLLKKTFSTEANHIINNFVSVLKYGKNQVFELRDLMKNIDVTKIVFLKNVKSFGLKWNILAKFLLFLLKAFVFPVLCEYFYITESRGSFNKLSYYKKPDWQRLKYSVLHKLVACRRWKGFTKTVKLFTATTNVDTCYVRFIPKGKFSARPIIWRRRNSLVETQIFLSQLCLLNTKSNNFNNLNHFYKLWMSLVTKWRTRNNGRIYFVKVDIRDAYGSINIGKLSKSVESCWKIFGDNEKNVMQMNITLRELKCFKKLNGKIQCYLLKRFDELPSNVPRNCVIVPTTKTRELKLQHLISIIKREIRFTSVQIANKKYVVTKGVSQGGRLSPALCRLYYDYIDLKYLSTFRKDGDDLLIRAVDDYLFVTPDLERAKAFLMRMEAGFFQNSCFINKRKTVTNFGDDAVDLLSFYGLLINTNSMEILGNYESYKRTNIFHTIAFKTRSNPGEFLKQRMKFLASLKLNDIFLDSLINSKRTILLNVLKASLLMAFRFHAIVANLFKTYNIKLFSSCIEQFAGCVAARVTVIAKRNKVPDAEALHKSMVVWTVYRGFFLKLDKEKHVITSYTDVIDFLKNKFMILFCQLSTDQQTLLREISKYAIEDDDDFKGTT